jgi:phenylalanyl-tRNA synthetase beta chain
MRIPLSWLKKYLNVDITAEKVSEVLTLAGLEVEGIDRPKFDFEGVVVGKVVRAEKHPNADKLRVATVSDGVEEFQVVCGAANCREGLLTAFAKIGASLKDPDGKIWKIKKSKLRDVESFGMLCAASELGLPGDSEGILELGADVRVGTDLRELYGDAVLEISLTPNLGHCMSVIGIARELAAQLNVPLVHARGKVVEDATHHTQDLIQVDVQDKEKCLRYSCRVVRNVKVGPSPQWLKSYLEACGMRSINNVVDVGNFVMMEMGQPLHMFDYGHIADKKLIITTHAPEKTFVGLNDLNIDVPEGALVIADAKHTLALAGVMGGKESGVTEATHNIVIESAYFSPQALRKASKRAGVRTDSSQRFEKGIDPNGVVEALNRAAELIHEVAGGTVCAGVIDLHAHAFPRKQISCRASRVNELLGTQLSLNEITALLKRLDITVKQENDDLISTEVPTYRHDLQQEIDLVEEVARTYGYNNLPKTTPRYTTSNIPDSEIYLIENQARTGLIGEGLQEWITCDLIGPALAELTTEASMPSKALISVLHPSSVDQSILRTSLLPCFLQVVKNNQAHQNYNLSAFEVGRIHFKDQEKLIEQSVAGILLAGKRSPYHWDPKPRTVDFFDLKGIVENVLQGFQIEKLSFEISHLHNFHPGRQARIKMGNTVLGVIGEVHPAHLQKLEIDGAVLFAEINLHDVMALRKKTVQVTPLPAYPGSERDWTLTMDDATPVGNVIELIQRFKSPLLEKVSLLDLYKSEQIGKDRKNATFRFVYRDLQKTVSQETVEQEHAKLVQHVAEKLKH